MKTIGDLLEHCIKITRETKSDVFFEYDASKQMINIKLYYDGYTKEQDNIACYICYPNITNLACTSIDIENISELDTNNIVLNIINWIDQSKVEN